MNLKWILATCLALPLAMAGTPAQVATGPDLTFGCPPDGMQLSELIATATSVCGEPFFFEERDLKDARVFFQGTIVVPREKVLGFVEWCLRDGDFVVLESQQSGRRVHVIRKLGQQARGQQALKTMARVVELAELRQLTDRWLLVTTTYTTRNLPTRELVTTLQLYFADSATESIRNIEGTDAILMTGFAANVASVVAMCDRLDAEAGASPARLAMKDLDKRIAAVEERLSELEAAGKPPARKQ